MQIAALDPPQLRCVVTVCSTDDRYADDVHYAGGALLASEMLPWAATMLAYNARPGDPAVLGESWFERWLERLEATVPYAEEWVTHQRRDAYWKHGSVCEDFSAIKVPVYAVGGWNDQYRGAVFRLMSGLDAAGVQVKGLLGPWAHNYPHQGLPGPAIDFVGECVRWFDRWMRDGGADGAADTDAVDTGGADGTPPAIDAEPGLRVWMPEPAPLGADREHRAGRWITEPHWPSPGVTPRRTPLRDLGGAPGTAVLRSPLAIGATTGDFLKFGDTPGQYADQAPDDGRACSFTGRPLAERVEILGVPEVTLRVTSDRPVAELAVRLCEVTPDGASRLVTTGLLNLTHRAGHAEPEPLRPGRTYEVTVPLFAVGHAFGTGNRIRVAVSASLWPWMWPSPELVALELDTEYGELTLPVREGDPAREAAPRDFGPPPPPPPGTIETETLPGARRVTYDPESREQVVVVTPADSSMTDLADGLTHSARDLNRFRLVEGDPLSASVECEREERIGRGEWAVRVHTRSRMTADEHDFLIVNRLVAYEGSGPAEREVFARTWTRSIPRDQV